MLGSSSFVLCRKSSQTKKALLKWNKATFGNVQSKVKAVTHALDVLYDREPSSINIGKIRDLRVELDEVLRREEIFWKQKSRVKWLDDGECSTQFFHLLTIIRRRRNAIDFIKQPDGSWSLDPEEINQTFISEFVALFTSTNSVFPNDLEGLIAPVVSTDDNTSLCAIPDEDEIRKVLFSIGSTKAPGPDGLAALFYKHFWDIVKYDFVASVKSFFQVGFMLKEINHTNIALISKKDGASAANHFRPISLCNIVYKTI